MVDDDSDLIALQRLCEDLSEGCMNKDRIHDPLSDQIRNVQFQVEEASAVLDSMAIDSKNFQSTLVPELMENSSKLAVNFAKIDIVQVF